jgi:hypothetical protein
MHRRYPTAAACRNGLSTGRYKGEEARSVPGSPRARTARYYHIYNPFRVPPSTRPKSDDRFSKCDHPNPTKRSTFPTHGTLDVHTSTHTKKDRSRSPKSASGNINQGFDYSSRRTSRVSGGTATRGTYFGRAPSVPAWFDDASKSCS